ncbi:NADH-quinone oxidoreductase subunit L [Numidum massiliense]|uniref:NADH-quinone oxidoreductase subunit L n=1 Tax=Numidum massiliense TaxID=1522315 RepID=UPI0006D57006|nr:NADH-quinone oxidoreductase subunit L [Numidum massiliense]
MLANAWLIPLFPLIAFLLILVSGRKMNSASSFVGMLATLVSLVTAGLVFFEQLTSSEQVRVAFEWFNVGETSLTMGFEVDSLNALMLLIVSLVSFLVHLYSRGYMAGDERISVYYAYLALFTFSMLGLVIAPNLLQLFIFWELVGLSSFLLIGFWYFKPAAKAAAKKAFIVTRIGDIGLFTAMILLFWQVGSFEYAAIFAAVDSGKIAAGALSLIAVLIFVGAVGKSGQFPLHTWLPDAMEGPTPVSALIHAATMVAAGVYLVARLFPLMAASTLALDVVAYVGAFTAIFAALIALAQNDIKRVLAYSTVSQLGYMMFALGSSGYTASLFHLTTHAFFKALLFLAAGAVIYAWHGEQDIRRMGGFFQRNKAVGTLFLIGCLSLAGVPPFSGFFSKEEILAAAYADGRFGVFTVGVVAAFLTALYVFRLFYLVFTGEVRGKQSELMRVPAVMTGPMWVLALFSVGAGFVQTPWYDGLARWLTGGGNYVPAAESGGAPLWVPFVAIAVSLAGIFLAWTLYGKQQRASAHEDATPSLGYRLLANKFYIDELYAYGIVKPLGGLGYALQVVDRYIVDGLVAFVAKVAVMIGRGGSKLQNGQVQTYGLVTALGAVLLLLVLTIGGYFG